MVHKLYTRKVNSSQMRALVWKMSADVKAFHYYHFNYTALESVLRKTKPIYKDWIISLVLQPPKSGDIC